MNLNIQDPSQDRLRCVIDFYSKRKFKEAIKEINILLKDFKNSAVLYNIYGLIYFNLKQYDASMNCYNKAIIINRNIIWISF